MPEYLYIDENGHNTNVTHRMLYTSSVICTACGEEMWRKPHVVGVIWGGFPPSGPELTPEVQHMIDNADERRDMFLEGKEVHDSNSEV